MFSILMKDLNERMEYIKPTNIQVRGVLSTLEARNQIKNACEQPEKLSEIKNIKFGDKRRKGLYSKRQFK